MEASSLDAKTRMAKRILSAYDEAKEACVEDPGRKIIQAIAARKQVILFLNEYDLQ